VPSPILFSRRDKRSRDQPLPTVGLVEGAARKPVRGQRLRRGSRRTSPCTTSAGVSSTPKALKRDPQHGGNEKNLVQAAWWPGFEGAIKILRTRRANRSASWGRIPYVSTTKRAPRGSCASPIGTAIPYLGPFSSGDDGGGSTAWQQDVKKIRRPDRHGGNLYHLPPRKLRKCSTCAPRLEEGARKTLRDDHAFITQGAACSDDRFPRVLYARSMGRGAHALSMDGTIRSRVDMILQRT